MSNRQKSLRLALAGAALILISSITFASPWSAAMNWLGLESAPAENIVQPTSKNLAPETVVLSDDFEGATTFVAANTGVNTWVIGTAAANGGTKGAYVSSDAGVSNTYNNTVTTGNHIYAPIVVPAGETAVVLSFDWRTLGDYDATADFDYMRVSVRSAIPVGGTLPTAAEQIPVTFSGQDNYTRAYVNLPASVATGTTQYLVFSWSSDTSVGTLPAAIDNVLVTSQAPAPLSGTKTIPGDYPTIGAAIANVNANGADTSGGSLTFNVAAASVFTETPFPLTVSGSSAANRIVFVKSGGGANPKIIAEGGGNFGAPNATAGSGVTSTSDAIIALNGVDFTTFDGIDVQSNSPSASSPFSKVEYGYLLRNNNILANVTTINGSQNNIIQNTSITLDRRKTSPTQTIGIMQSAATGAFGAGSAATSAAQANSGNKYYNLSIQNAYAGIYLLGTAAFPDDLTEVGTTSPTSFNSIGAATANDLGNGTVLSWGIRAGSQSNAKFFNNEIRNITSTGTTTVAGIHLDNAGTVTAVSLGTTEVYRNIIHDLNGVNAAAGVISGVRANITGNAGSSSRIYNNFIYGLNSTSTVTASRRIIGIVAQDAGVGTGSTHNINNNSVRIAPVTVGASNTCFEIGGAAATNPIYNVRNNIFANFTGAQAGAAKHYTWVSTSSTSIGLAAGTVSDFNDLYIDNTTNGFVGLGSATDFATLANWQAMQAGAGPDDNSISANPLFAGPTDLHITGGSPARNTGTTIAFITNDIDNEARPNEAIYEIGADEFYPQPGILQLSSATYSGLEGGTANATVNRVAGSSGIVGVTYTLTNGSAVGGAACTAGIDYINPGPQLLSFGDSVTSQPITVTLCTDAVIDMAETFTITLSLPTGGASLGSPTVATVTITDVAPPFNGSYSVGTGQDYTSLTNPGGIFEAINTSGATGNIVINITSDLTSETGTVALNQIAGGFTVGIQPSGGPRTISGSNTTALININGADGVTFSGLAFGPNALTIRNTNAASGGVFRYINDASNNSILSCIVEQNNSVNTAILYSTGTTTGNDNNSITSSIVRGTSSTIIPFNSIATIGTSAAISNSNLIVTDNQLTNFGQAAFLAGTGTDGFTFTGNDVSQTASRTTSIFAIVIGAGSTVTGTNNITNNRIHSLTSNSANPTIGILVGTGGVLNITGNRIYDFQTTAGATGAITGIEFDGVSGGTPSVIAVNNFVSIAPTVSTSQAITGIFDFAFGGNIFTANHNTMYIGGVGSGTASTWGLRRGTGAPTTYTARNNIAFNNRTGGTGSHFAGGDQSANTGTFVSDGNFFAGTGATAANFMDYGTSSSGTPVSFAAWQAGPPARDAASNAGTAGSFTVANIFVDAANHDLHLRPTAGANVLSAGLTTVGVTTDIDGDPRPNPATAPDRGADELVEASSGLFPSGTFYNASISSTSFAGNVTITNTLYVSGINEIDANTFTIGCNATVVGAGTNNYIVGNVAKNFCGTGLFIFPVGTSADNALADGASPEGNPPEYTPLDANVTAGTFPSTLTVSVTDDFLPGVVQVNAVSRNWSVTETGDLTVDMTFHYLDPKDVSGNEALYKVFKYVSGPSATMAPPPNSVDTVNNTLFVGGVTSFSRWGGAAAAATASTVSISGRVTTANGNGIRNAAMILTGNSLPAPIIVQTGSLGSYSFDNLRVGETYVLQVGAKRFRFTNPSHVITLQDSISDMDFVANPQD